MSNTRREPGSGNPESRDQTQHDEPGRHLDASDLLFEVGRRVQAVALVMRRHEIASGYQVCECGRVPVRILPMFGLRCEIACCQWDLACALVRRLVEHMSGQNLADGMDRRAIGRAMVSTHRPGRGADDVVQSRPTE